VEVDEAQPIIEKFLIFIKVKGKSTQTNKKTKISKLLLLLVNKEELTTNIINSILLYTLLFSCLIIWISIS